MGASATCREAPILASLWHQCPLCLGPGYLIPQVGARAHLLAAQRLAKCKAAVSRFPSGKQTFLSVRCIRVPVSPGPGKGTATAALDGAQGPNRGCFSYPFADEQTGSGRSGQTGLQAPHWLALPSLPASPIHAQGLCAASTCFSPSVAMAGRPHTGLGGTEMLESWSEMPFVVAQTKGFTP